MNKTTIGALTLTALMSLSANATAAEVTYDFSGGLGQWSASPSFPSQLPPELDISSAPAWLFTGSVIIDHDAPDMSSQITQGYYPGSVLGLSLHVNGIDFSVDPSSPPAFLFTLVRDNDSLLSNSINISAQDFQPGWLAALGAGDLFADVSINYVASDLTQIESDALPANLGDWSPWRLDVSIFQAGEGGISQLWRATSTVNLTPRPAVSVPEPATLTLMGLGLAALGLRRRFSKGESGTPASAAA
jgi:hypothetical protein